MDLSATKQTQNVSNHIFMTMTQLKFSLFVILFCSTCATQHKDIIGAKLADCYKSKFYNQDDKLSDPFPYYKEFENVLIEKGYLSGTRKSDYENLWLGMADESREFDIKQFTVKLEP